MCCAVPKVTGQCNAFLASQSKVRELRQNALSNSLRKPKKILEHLTRDKRSVVF